MQSPPYSQSNDDPPGWVIRSLRAAREPRDPTRWVIDGLFSEGSLNIVYGPPASLKSMIVLDACMAVAGGHQWMVGTRGAGIGIAVSAAPVLWYDYDNGTRRTDERVDAVSAGHNLPDGAPFYYVSMPEYNYMATDLDRNLYLMSVITQLGAKLVVIDNLGLITGDVEENSAAMAQVMASLRIIAERTRSAVVVIHHQRKGGAAGGRAGDALRGHSSIEAAVDLALHVMREQDSRDVTVRSTKTRGVDVAPIWATFNYEHRVGTNDLARAWFTGKAIERGVDPIREAIERILYANPDGLTKGKLRQYVVDSFESALAPGLNKVSSWIDEMAAHGQLTIRQGENNAKLITLR